MAGASARPKEGKRMNLLIGILIIVIDQIIKIIISLNISYGYTIGKWIKITNIANTGVAYSIRKQISNNNNNSKYFYYLYTNRISNKKL